MNSTGFSVFMIFVCGTLYTFMGEFCSGYWETTWKFVAAGWALLFVFACLLSGGKETPSGTNLLLFTGILFVSGSILHTVDDELTGFPHLLMVLLVSFLGMVIAFVGLTRK